MNPLASIRAYLGIAAVVALLALGWWAYELAHSRGAESVKKIWDAEKAEQVASALKESEERRAKEKVLNSKVAKVSNDYAKLKAAHSAYVADTDGKLRDLQAALSGSASDDPGTAPGVDGDPRPLIASQCAAALVRLDGAVKQLAGQTVALQNYANTVSVED